VNWPGWAPFSYQNLIPAPSCGRGMNYLEVMTLSSVGCCIENTLWDLFPQLINI
jgi:hypothetical protein